MKEEQKILGFWINTTHQQQTNKKKCLM